MAATTGTAAVTGRGRHQRRPVMAEINVTPMVDVMLVLLIIFMVSAPLLTVGVPINLAQSRAKSTDVNKEPLIISVNSQGQIYLQNSEIRIEDLVKKLTALTEAGAGTNEAIVFRGDKDVKYGVAARVLGRLNEAGFRNVLLLTEVEQGA
jgi:biopolymer transport protein TolR